MKLAKEGPVAASETVGLPSPKLSSPAMSTIDAAIPLFPRAAARREAGQLVGEAGAPLDESTQRYFGDRFAHDFSHVRVHTGERAARSASGLAARAFTVGPHVGFGRGEYAPNTPQGLALLAHELAHVVQQSRGGPIVAGAAGRELEVAADDAATQAVNGQRISVVGRSAMDIACKSMFEQFTDGAYAPGLLLEALQHTRPTWQIVEDVNSLGSPDRTQAIKDIEAERAVRKARQDDLTAKRAAQTDPTTRAAIGPELTQVSRVLARIDTVLGGLALRRPIPGWNFTPGDFANLQRAKKTLTFASDSGWFPAPLQHNLKKTLEFVLDPARSPAATEGVNAVDFFHGHLVVPVDPATKKDTMAATKAKKKGYQADAALKAAREKEFGQVGFSRNPIKTPAAFGKYNRILEKQAATYARVMEEAAQLPGAAVMYHTFEWNNPSDKKAQGKTQDYKDPRRHYVTPLDTNSPRQYDEPAGEDNYEKDFTHITKFLFQIDAQGAIHVRPFDTSTSVMTLEISAITGQTYPDTMKFDEGWFPPVD